MKKWIKILLVLIPAIILVGWMLYATDFQGFPFDYGFYRDCTKIKEGMAKEEVIVRLKKYIDNLEFYTGYEKPVKDIKGRIIYEEMFTVGTGGYSGDELSCGGMFNKNILVQKIISFD